MSSTFTSIDEYINSFEGICRDKLMQIRSIISTALPGANEGINYNIPAYSIDGVWVMYFSGYKSHISLSFYPSEETHKHFESELRSYKYSKSAIQFPLDQQLPVGLIGDIVRHAVPYRLALKKGKK